MWGTAIYNTIRNSGDIDGAEKEKYQLRQVQIDRLGVSLAQFDLNLTTKNALVESGRQGVISYFKQLGNKYLQSLVKQTVKNDKVFAQTKVSVGTMWAPKAAQPTAQAAFESGLNLSCSK